MKIGDKVRFLNTTGGGVVKGFQGKDVVLVEDGDGFDIPVLIRETVVIEPANDAQVRQSSKPTDELQQRVSAKPVPVEEEYIPEETREGEQLSVQLAYLPVDIKNLSTTAFECYLVNDSNYYLSFNYMSRSDEGWTSRNTGLIEPNTKLFLEEFDKTELNAIEHICLQFFAYKQNKPFTIKNVYSVEVRIDTVKFYKLHSFKENDYFEDEAIVYPVVRRDLAEKELVVSAEKLEIAMKQKEGRPRIQPIVKKEKNAILEIDLHADELLDSTNGLSAGDILEYQLKTFRDTMDENKRNKGQKIVFIHGKGDGVLKNAILKELKTNYKSAYYQDASFREYGYGATMITIR
ncbi:hypothetical protein M2451_002392 [Dysgonomonas sp. PFB1-18]|uniref:DUF2027 domain-containing protein n=1 Tax=unclassified Dysgonomonas TaxID=2630389 RepID=UPI0024761345|nr:MULTISPECIES: DUF2027 domain-containing protein [unclassified Dysgonomonas]MDL2302912.1 DUF2027 domain-containing protein [Dysgonomonas sp. OttesenSCG-928-D17]MDH6307158.1 hypothetical protein [Dysgonomonas sp. PF1-14]MDH6337077.1 hypothetical protein [Dysgonomonas sp. PF1-16]MDH6381063.1 hypothetical protein [Dysgonomonas sp. PFB1-18]MDH6396358.1 hypothetical protein [Dysgonomonas sp. PF1-23]